MSALRRGRFLAIACLAGLVIALPGCGGDEESAGPQSGASSESSVPDGTARRSGASTPAGAEGSTGGGGQAADRGGKTGGAGDLEVPLRSIPDARVTPAGAVQTLAPSAKAHETAQKNSYTSIKEFGAAASGSEATDITFALVQYLNAKVEGDWDTACARLHSSLVAGLADLTGNEDAGCASNFAAAMKRIPPGVLAEQAKIDVSSVRRGEADRAFVIYKTPETLSADMPMFLEDGVWKVGALEAYVLTPEQAR